MNIITHMLDIFGETAGETVVISGHSRKVKERDPRAHVSHAERSGIPGESAPRAKAKARERAEEKAKASREFATTAERRDTLREIAQSLGRKGTKDSAQANHGEKDGMPTAKARACTR